MAFFLVIKVAQFCTAFVPLYQISAINSKLNPTYQSKWKVVQHPIFGCTNIKWKFYEVQTTENVDPKVLRVQKYANEKTATS